MVSRTRSFPHVIIAKPVHNLCSGFSFLFHLYSGIFFVNTTHVGASFARLAPTFSYRRPGIRWEAHHLKVGLPVFILKSLSSTYRCRPGPRSRRSRAAPSHAARPSSTSGPLSPRPSPCRARSRRRPCRRRRCTARSTGPRHCTPAA